MTALEHQAVQRRAQCGRKAVGRRRLPAVAGQHPDMRQQHVDLPGRRLAIGQPVAVDHRGKVPWGATDDRAKRGIAPLPQHGMLSAVGNRLQRADQFVYRVLQRGGVRGWFGLQAVPQRKRLCDGAAPRLRGGKRARGGERPGRLAIRQQRVEQRDGGSPIARQAGGETLGKRHAGAPAQQGQRRVDMARRIGRVERDARWHGFFRKRWLVQAQCQAWMHRVQRGFGALAITVGSPRFGTEERLAELAEKTAQGGKGRGKHDGGRLGSRAGWRNVALPCELAVETGPTL